MYQLSSDRPMTPELVCTRFEVVMKILQAPFKCWNLLVIAPKSRYNKPVFQRKRTSKVDSNKAVAIALSLSSMSINSGYFDNNDLNSCIAFS